MPKPPPIPLALTLLVFFAAGSLYYWRSPSVRLTADGRTRRIFTRAPTVGEFLTEQTIPLGSLDLITPSASAAIGHKTAVRITRVSTQTVVAVSTAPPVVAWQMRTRQNLRRVLVQRGHRTQDRQTLKITRHDGVEVSRKVLKRHVRRRPFHTLTLFDARGLPIKTYDLLKAKKLLMRSTGYYVGEPTVPSDTTFLGYKLRRGLVAVDPKTIPLRTRLYVEGYGYAYAADTGSAIKKLRIDLAVSGKKEERKYNRKNVPVYILEKARKW